MLNKTLGGATRETRAWVTVSDKLNFFFFKTRSVIFF